MLTNLFAILLIAAATFAPCQARATDRQFGAANSGVILQPSSISAELYRAEGGSKSRNAGSKAALHHASAIHCDAHAAPTLGLLQQQLSLIAQSPAKSDSFAAEQTRDPGKSTVEPIDNVNKTESQQSGELKPETSGNASQESNKEIQKKRSGKSSREPESTRVFKARLRGSMCAACLIQLEEKLQKMHGVLKARIVRPESTSEERFAEIEILYVQPTLTQQKIRRLIERNDFGLSKEKDSAAG
ncbi:MAG: hypothetical protein K2X93_09755 [Candidatus Obscuribacterales bacterium]|nr:hypothetical protein [Candidatus Obscuribacterales bacterium]